MKTIVLLGALAVAAGCARAIDKAGLAGEVKVAPPE